MSAFARGAPDNPFATRHHRPGAIAFVFEAGASPGALLDRLEAAREGQIVGPHGTGKSTLVHALAEEASRRGTAVTRVVLRAGDRRLPRGWRTGWPAGPHLFVLDGAEQLSRLGLAILRWRCRRAGAGLLVTTHAPLGLPTLHETRVDPALARRLVAGLLDASDSPRLVSPDDVLPVLEDTRGDLREALLRLYDLYEKRWRER